MRKYILLLLIGLSGRATYSQFYNTGTYYVSPSTIFYTNGSFTNTATASYQNDGTVYISGNTSNSQASMPAGAGTTIFDGTSTQTLSGSAPFRSLNMTLNNAAGLTLTNRLAIGDGSGGTFTFTSGRITTGNNTQDVYFYPGAVYTGYDATHHIIGYVTKSGQDNFDFPIGDGTHTADLALSGISAAADFQVLYTGTGYGNYTLNSPLVAGGVFDKEWWDLAQTAGTASARVSLKWNDSRYALNHSSPATLVVAHFSGGSWSSAGGNSSDPSGSSTGTVGPSNLVSSFSPFTFGSTLTPLPVLLSSFNVMNDNCQASLSWTTTLEQNAQNFNVQTSTDNVNFHTVAIIPAADSPATYHTNVSQMARQAFYRLQMVDKDGKTAYSTVDLLTLTCLTTANQLVLFPNPRMNGNQLQAKFTSPDARGRDELQVFDAKGMKVYSQTVNVNSGVNLYTLNIEGLAKGVYTVLLKGSGIYTSFLQP